MKRSALILVAGLAAGCAAGGGGGGASLVFDVRPLSSSDEAFVASRGAGQPAVVIGGDAAATAARLRLPQKLGGGGFAPAQAGASGSRLVFAFSGLSPEALCASAGGGDGGGGEASAAWCLDGRPLAYARGRGAALASPDAPGFEAAARRMTNAMLAPLRTGRRS